MKNSHWEFFGRKLVENREHNTFYFKRNAPLMGSKRNPQFFRWILFT